MDEFKVEHYKKINEEEKEQASRFAELLIWKYQPTSVLDVGCATGLYLKPFIDKGIVGIGVDNSVSVIADEVLQIPRELIEIADIVSQPIKSRADLTICLEVLEHIPDSGAPAAIDHITKTSNLIFFSAAVPGQGGLGHVNCQPKEYWQKLFSNNGFGRNETDEQYIRIIMEAGYHMGWLINNLMVFNNSLIK